jgi:hypothetical protein
VATSRQPIATGTSGAVVLEFGDLFFFYRPRVDHDPVRSLDDVARLELVLHPRERSRYRLLIVGQKRLPAPRGQGNPSAWAYVDMVSEEAQPLEDALDPERYATRTRGERTRPAARPAGEAIYAIARHGDHTHLAYRLELPRRPGEAQDALEIRELGNYIVVVRNPDTPSTGLMGLDPERRADYPPELRTLLGDRSFGPLDPPEFLDHRGAEIVLIGVGRDIEQQLGVSINAEQEDEASAEIFADLGLERALHPVEPLLEGRWA